MSMLAPEVVDLQHLEFEVPCSITPCPHTADWWLVCRACNRHVPWCEPCRRRETAAAATAPRGGWLVGCKGCGESVRPRQWRDLFDVIPIRPVGCGREHRA